MTKPLISVSELQSQLSMSDLQVFDCRFSLMDPAHGRTQYEKSHIPGAIFIDVNKDLSTPHVPGKTGRHPLPAQADWIKTVCRLGLTPEKQVVLYDDGGGASSSRMWWMLKWIGHDNVSVLDGGWQAWNAAALPTTAEAPPAPQMTSDQYSSRTSLVTLLTADQIDAAQQTLIDARDLPRFKGEVETIDPIAGHIPGAVCSPASANLTADGRFKDAEALREKFRMASDSDKPVVCYCGSGITACHNTLAMAAAGLPLPALYAGSWSEWITDAARAIAKGE